VTTTTSIVCNKCGRTAAVTGPNYPSGWLVHQRKNAPKGHLVIRCPDHITGHSKRLADLPQNSTSKRITDNLDRGLWCNYAGHYIASAAESQDFETGETAYWLSYHAGKMPAFKSECFGAITDLIAAMRNVEPDLRKWRLSET